MANGIDSLLWLGYLLLGFLLCRVVRRQRHPLRTAALSSGCGLLGLLGLYLAAPFTGIAVSINFFTTATALIFGLPGMVGILFLHLI